MKILIEQARIIDRSSPHNGTVRDILIENGRIISIGPGPGNASAESSRSA